MSDSSFDADAPSIAPIAFILDDNEQIATLVGKIVEMCGLCQRQFTAPEPFLLDVEIAPPDLIILDLSLGTSDAVEVMRQLERLEFGGRVLLISGRGEEILGEITQIGVKHGLAMLPPLRKPFRAADLRQRLSIAPAVPVVRRPAHQPTSEAGSAKGAVQVVEALQKGWLDLWYQPKIDLAVMSVFGAEALIRVDHPVHGLLMPADLLPPPGDPDYQPLTEFVVKRAIADWKHFSRTGWHPQLAVNVPASVISTPAFLALVRSAMPGDASFPGLIVEITEDEVIRDSDWAREAAIQLKLYGVGISIDDFGAGYASLSRLNDLPFAEIKIDRSLVLGCATDPLKFGLCRTVIDLAHRFGGTACAEGVENEKDLGVLIGMGCDAAQGFLFAKAMPFAKFDHEVLDKTFQTMASFLRMPAASKAQRV